MDASVRKMLLGSVALVALTSAHGARAADMPVHKAPPPWSWTGFYAGGNAGYGIARDPGTFANQILSPAFPLTVPRYNFSPAGVIAGGQVGFNWQFTPHWVGGLEADIQASDQWDNFTCILNCLNVPAIGSLNGTTVQQRLPWFGTVRGRVGWTNGPALWYLTGGLAYAELRTDINTIQQTGAPVLFRFSDKRTGWTIGGGVEHRLTGNWTAKVEYLYMDLGSVAHSFTYTANDPLVGFPTSNAYTSEIRDHIVRLGLNYKFGGDPDAVSP